MKEEILFDTARLIQVIETTLTRRGEGKDASDPVRVVRQYWSSNGELLAEVDPFRSGSNENSHEEPGALAEVTIILDTDGKHVPAIRVNSEVFKFDRRFETYCGVAEYCRQLKQSLRKTGCRIMGENK